MTSRYLSASQVYLLILPCCCNQIAQPQLHRYVTGKTLGAAPCTPQDQENLQDGILGLSVVLASR